MVNYEETLFWLARVGLFMEERYQHEKHASNAEYNLAKSQLREAVCALGSQNPLWPATAARLSGTSGDLGLWEFERAKDTLRLPGLCQELQKLVTDCFGECPAVKEPA